MNRKALKCTRCDGAALREADGSYVCICCGHELNKGEIIIQISRDLDMETTEVLMADVGLIDLRGLPFVQEVK